MSAASDWSKKVGSLFHARDNGLSSEERFQLRIHRVLTLLGAILLFFGGCLEGVGYFTILKPLGVAHGIAGLLVGILISSYWLQSVRRHYVNWVRGTAYVIMVWVVFVGSANRFGPRYAVALPVAYAVLAMIVVLGARTVRPVFSFVGFGLLVAAGTIVFGPPPQISPLVLLTSMVAVTTGVGLACWRQLLTMEALRTREKRLRRSRERLAEAQRIANLGSWERDFVRDELYWSDETRRIFGWGPEEDVRYQTFMDAVHPDDRDALRDQQERLQTEGVPIDLEYRIFRPDGEERVVRERGEGEFDDDGSIRRMAGTVLDITKRVERERELERTHERMELALEATSAVVWDLDVGSGETTFYPTSAVLYGADIHTLDGFLQQVHSEDRTRVEEDLRRGMETGEYSAEFRIQRDKETRWISSRGRFDFDSDGRPVRGTGVAQDVTDRKRKEQQLREAKEEAEVASRMKSSFLANMRHEIRTPLTSVIGFAEAIRTELDEDSGPIARFTHLIEEGGQRLLNTLNAVLTFSRLEAGEKDVCPESANLVEEIRRVGDLFQRRAEKAGVELRIEEPERSAWGYVDREGLRLALRSLVSNAIKYTEENGMVWVRTRRDADVVAVEVEDTGIGMHPEKVSELFEPFRQGSEGIRREYEGSGLGLAVTRRVIDHMGGTIEVETDEGVGSCFTVRLPPAQPQDPQGHEGP